MSTSDELELELTSDPKILPGVRDTLHRWALPHGWSEDQAAEIALAVDESLSNVIRHAYGCKTTYKIKVTVQPVRDPAAGEGVEIRVRDFGKQIHPSHIKGRNLDDVRPGGLGVHLIRAMMNTAEYSCANGGGMLLVMRKYKDHRARGG